jgi:hypothetical protein
MGRVGSGKLMLVLVSTVVLILESHGTHDHILLSRPWEACNSVINLILGVGSPRINATMAYESEEKP